MFENRLLQTAWMEKKAAERECRKRILFYAPARNATVDGTRAAFNSHPTLHTREHVEKSSHRGSALLHLRTESLALLAKPSGELEDDRF